MNLFKHKALNNPWSRTKLKINIANTARWAIIITPLVYYTMGVFDLTWTYYVGAAIIYLVSQYFIDKLQLIADYQMTEILRAEDSGRYRDS